MGDFADLAAAETRAVAQMEAGTWLNAHAARHTTNGKFCCRVQRPMSPTNPGYGEWTEIDDDTAD